ncbi:MAG: hypothetical protein U0694_07535 [Anaerolineae bacterium]
MTTLKILVTGSLARRTVTFIRKISTMPAMFAELEGIPLGLDFGLVRVDRATQVYLYGTPALKHFQVCQLESFLSASAQHGVVLLANTAGSSAEVAALRSAVRAAGVPHVIALHDAAGTAQAPHNEENIIPCDVESAQDVRTVLFTLLARMAGAA